MTTILATWTLAPGRTICFDGKPIARLSIESFAEGERYLCAPYVADALAHAVVDALGRAGVTLEALEAL